MRIHRLAERARTARDDLDDILDAGWVGTLSVSVSDCRYPANDPAANAYAHVMISDATGATDFDGWMIASSPALSALDHPRYDVWVLRCMSN